MDPQTPAKAVGTTASTVIARSEAAKQTTLSCHREESWIASLRSQ
jgi:hypothetical protein